MTITIGDRINPPVFGAPIKDAFLQQTYDNSPGQNYNGMIKVNCKSNVDHHPAAHIITRHSDDWQLISVQLRDGAAIIGNENPSDWAQSHDLIKASPDLFYRLNLGAVYVSHDGPGAAGPDPAVKITGKCFQNAGTARGKHCSPRYHGDCQWRSALHAAALAPASLCAKGLGVSREIVACDTPRDHARSVCVAPPASPTNPGAAPAVTSPALAATDG